MNRKIENIPNLSQERVVELIDILNSRFDKNMNRHKNIEWKEVQIKLSANPEKLWSLNEMEETGGEPDVVGYDKGKDQYIFYDCAAESPKGRRSLCYDHEALESRKKFKPKNSAVVMASEMGIKILNEIEYFALQLLGEFDTKTSSWLATPPEIRDLGGSIFGDRRFGRVFTYHNGAESYYAGRGFRGSLRI
ncbi:MAG: DUF4256 domain-containing protein [Balneolaceae bacterium]